MSINADDFKTKLVYPTKPIKPAFMNKRWQDLTADEKANGPAMADEYHAALAAYTKDRSAYNDDDARLFDEFKTALETDHGIVGHPNADRLFALAREYGGGCGLGEIALHYGELADLVVGTTKNV